MPTSMLASSLVVLSLATIALVSVEFGSFKNAIEETDASIACDEEYSCSDEIVFDISYICIISCMVPHSCENAIIYGSNCNTVIIEALDENSIKNAKIFSPIGGNVEIIAKIDSKKEGKQLVSEPFLTSNIIYGNNSNSISINCYNGAICENNIIFGQSSKMVKINSYFDDKRDEINWIGNRIYCPFASKNMIEKTSSHASHRQYEKHPCSVDFFDVSVTTQNYHKSNKTANERKIHQTLQLNQFLASQGLQDSVTFDTEKYCADSKNLIQSCTLSMANSVENNENDESSGWSCFDCVGTELDSNNIETINSIDGRTGDSAFRERLLLASEETDSELIGNDFTRIADRVVIKGCLYYVTLVCVFVTILALLDRICVSKADNLRISAVLKYIVFYWSYISSILFVLFLLFDDYIVYFGIGAGVMLLRILMNVLSFCKVKRHAWDWDPKLLGTRLKVAETMYYGEVNGAAGRGNTSDKKAENSEESGKSSKSGDSDENTETTEKMQWCLIVLIALITTGDIYSVVDLCSSHILSNYVEWFNLRLNRNNLKQLKKYQCYYLLFLQIIPMMILQGIFLYFETDKISNILDEINAMDNGMNMSDLPSIITDNIELIIICCLASSIIAFYVIIVDLLLSEICCDVCCPCCCCCCCCTHCGRSKNLVAKMTDQLEVNEQSLSNRSVDLLTATESAATATHTNSNIIQFRDGLRRCKRSDGLGICFEVTLDPNITDLKKRRVQNQPGKVLRILAKVLDIKQSNINLVHCMESYNGILYGFIIKKVVKNDNKLTQIDCLGCIYDSLVTVTKEGADTNSVLNFAQELKKHWKLDDNIKLGINHFEFFYEIYDRNSLDAFRTEWTMIKKALVNQKHKPITLKQFKLGRFVVMYMSPFSDSNPFNEYNTNKEQFMKRSEINIAAFTSEYDYYTAMTLIPCCCCINYNTGIENARMLQYDSVYGKTNNNNDGGTQEKEKKVSNSRIRRILTPSVSTPQSRSQSTNETTNNNNNNNNNKLTQFTLSIETVSNISIESNLSNAAAHPSDASNGTNGTNTPNNKPTSSNNTGVLLFNLMKQQQTINTTSNASDANTMNAIINPVSDASRNKTKNIQKNDRTRKPRAYSNATKPVSARHAGHGGQNGWQHERSTGDAAVEVRDAVERMRGSHRRTSMEALVNIKGNENVKDHGHTKKMQQKQQQTEKPLKKLRLKRERSNTDITSVGTFAKESSQRVHQTSSKKSEKQTGRERSGSKKQVPSRKHNSETGANKVPKVKIGGQIFSSALSNERLDGKKGTKRKDSSHSSHSNHSSKHLKISMKHPKNNVTMIDVGDQIFHRSTVSEFETVDFEVAKQYHQDLFGGKQSGSNRSLTGHHSRNKMSAKGRGTVRGRGRGVGGVGSGGSGRGSVHIGVNVRGRGMRGRGARGAMRGANRGRGGNAAPIVGVGGV